MLTNNQRKMLTGLPVGLAMRRHPLRLSLQRDLDAAISSLIKFKINAALINDPDKDSDLGVISKTDLMTLYYAGLALHTPLAEVYVSPLVAMGEEATLESALSRMQGQGVKRVYVRDSEWGEITGVLSHADIVGLLYRYCCRCETRASRSAEGMDQDEFLLVRDVMRQDVVSCDPEQSIEEVLEILSAQPISALLVQEGHGGLPGAVSKTDLILAYRHGLPLQSSIREVASFPVLGCSVEEPLVRALRRMIMTDVQRLFVHSPEDPHRIQGVLSLTDAARARSGSCRACSASRIEG